jgi:hypothetical protein
VRSSVRCHLAKQSDTGNLAKLAVKVERQALAEADRTKLEERMQFTRENYRMMRERLLEIIYWKQGAPPARGRPQPRREQGRQEHCHDEPGDTQRRGRRRHVPEAN